jgi:methylase of polypeptide subunit release factors
MEYQIDCRNSSLTIHQQTDGNHGSTIWDSSLILCKYIDSIFSTLTLPSKTPIVIDLGSGTGIVGLYIAMLLDLLKSKSTIFLTDCEGVDLMTRNANEFKSEYVDVCAQELVWGETTDLKGMFYQLIDR